MAGGKLSAERLPEDMPPIVCLVRQGLRSLGPTLLQRHPRDANKQEDVFGPLLHALKGSSSLRALSLQLCDQNDAAHRAMQ